MTAVQQQAVNTIIETQMEIDRIYQIHKRIVETYGESELDEQLVEDIRTTSNQMVERLSRQQQQAIETYDTFMPTREGIS